MSYGKEPKIPPVGEPQWKPPALSSNRGLEKELAAFLETEEGKQLIRDAIAHHPWYEEVPTTAKGNYPRRDAEGPPPPKRNPGTPRLTVPREKPLGSTGSTRPDRVRGTPHTKGSSGGATLILIWWVAVLVMVAVYLVVVLPAI